MKLFQKINLAFFLLLFAAACGGGGGGSSSSSTPATVIRAAGTISAASSSAVDSDINDTSAPYSSNDSFGLAQPIPNPMTLGGYVNRPNTGRSWNDRTKEWIYGRSYAIGDTDDYFSVYLVQNQVIKLFIVNDQIVPPNLVNNQDLYLYDDSTPPVEVASSRGTGQTESVTVTTGDGNYFIRVEAALGYSNYVLSVGQSTSSAGMAGPLDPDADFVPGEIIVRFKDNNNSYGSMIAADVTSSPGLIRKAGSSGRAELMELGGKENRQKIMGQLGISSRVGAMSGLSFENEVSGLKRDTISVIEALRKRSDVLYAEPNYIRNALFEPDDTHYSLQWHYPLINLPQAWGVTTGSSSVIVAVIDTGVLLSHPDFVNLDSSLQLISGYDFISSIANALDGDGIDSDPDDPGDEGAGGSSFHGTHVAGTVAAATNNNLGVAGIAWGVKIMPVRVLGKTGGTSYDLIQSIKFAAGLANDSGTLPASAADIINMSLGGGGYSAAEQDVITDARAAGVIIIAAAGNNNSSTPGYPASYTGVVSVSAVDNEKNRAYYSNFGSTVDVAAPGGDLRVDTNGDGYSDGVLSTLGDDSSGSIGFTYAFYQGTSMAAPHVAGVAALMESVRPALTPTEFDTWLGAGDLTEDIGTAGRDDLFGYGLIDAFKAVNKAQSVIPVTPLLIINPASLNFGNSDTSATVSAINGGGGALTMDSFTANPASWLTVTATGVDANGLGTYTVTVNRGVLPDKTYTATITFTSSENVVTVPVIMQVDATTPDAGYHYILLLDPVTFDTKYQFDVGIDNGTYAYQFSSVATGEYIIIAGTDPNHNFIICEPGEACGAYRTVSDPITVNVNGDLSGLDFPSGFDLSFEAASFNNNLGVYGISPDRSIRRLR